MEQIGRFLLLMVAVAVVTFALVSLSPVDPLQANVGQAALLGMSEEKRAALAAYWGADSPMHERFFAWFGDLLRGDMGTSLRYNLPVADVIASRALNSLALMGVAWVVSGVLGFALGVLAAMNEGRAIDRAVKSYCFVLAASPTFWVGLLLLMVFAVGLRWFPIGFSVPVGMAAGDVTFADALRHMALPAITLSLVGVANVALHTRAKAIDIMASDYVRFARARGLTRWQALGRHGLRNLALPAVTLQFAQVAEIFGGSVLVEEVFSYPGLGQAAVTAGLGGDVALLAGIALVSAAVVFAGNLAANLIYGLVDPRMRPAVRQRPGGVSHASQALSARSAACPTEDETPLRGAVSRGDADDEGSRR
ncbi:ABC transporter permease [uncultured Adlercreutzia sp.]|uniref:ABC transporter permease n=1 Tax=uncultured Adlercreutzia sp. TaxID=875803 RepID=UPI0026F3864C|nr:ABC transporter permease [uncultured Adlercreutzia sp.]